MAEQHGVRRLSRADVLVAAVTCLLLILLVPVLFAKPREQSMRKLCGANLAQLGKAMFLYAGDNEGDLPRAGGRTTVWGTTPNWTAPHRMIAFNMRPDGTDGTASINASLYLLVKYCGVTPRVFVCKGDRGTTELKLSDLTGLWWSFKWSDAWDFGPPSESFKHCSYAYHIPYGSYPLSTSLDPNMAVAADRSPWINSPAHTAEVFPGSFKPDVLYPGGTLGTSAQARNGNSITHQRDGQNVLFLDGRVAFEKRAYCAVDKDNIYTQSTDPSGRGHVFGAFRGSGFLEPTNRRDSLLVHDPDAFGGIRR